MTSRVDLQHLLTAKDEQLAAEIQAKSAREVMAEFLFALAQLVVHHGVIHDLTDLSVNFHGRQLRVDVAVLSPDGQHLAEWLAGFDANVLSAGFGDAVTLPGTRGPVQ